MKTLLFYLILITLLSCGTSKSLLYNFESVNVADSITVNLKKYEKIHGGDYLKVKWFALVRENSGSYELIITENTNKKDFAFRDIIRKTNRYIKVSDQLRIPVIFDIDFLSEDFKKITRGTVNFGGYYFKISKDNGEYKVVQTGVLF
ncbi:MAG: hypothetical protein E6Q24_15230 [Chitinophagaceae bacterium]|nr:MAG: hypothetical protein E6Q24_15230 [Chitinophagaceae bacterium]